MNSVITEPKNPMAAKMADRLPILVILALLIFIIFARTGENLHAQVTKLGNIVWDDYFALRSEIKPPTCNPEMDINSRLLQLEANAQNATDEFDLFANEFNRDAALISLTTQKQMCVNEHAIALDLLGKVTPAVKVFRAMETQLSQASLFATAQQQIFLVILLFASAGVASQKRHHIAFRPMISSLDYRLSTTLQLVANNCLALSAWYYHEVTFGSGIDVSNPEIIYAFVLGSFFLASISWYQIFNLPKDTTGSGTLLHAMLSLPLYSFVMLIFAAIILVKQGHMAGMAIYFSSFFENAGTYLDIALYLWCGMLLKQTQLGERVFAVFTPWKLPPEILACLAIVVMAVPTAFTGASSIIILAMGAVVYRELRKVGTRRQLALAATAMSGSTGIVLRPCLVVVLISILNKEVVTDDLFYWGIRVFMLSSVVFFFYALITKKEPLRVAPFNEALKPSFYNLKNLLPYVAVFAAGAILYAVALDAYLDQFSAPIILPILIVLVIIYERSLSKAKPIYDDPERMATVYKALTKSMSDAAIHIGALLFLMATFSIMMGFAGASTSATFLENFDTTMGVMGVLVIMFVLIGMFTESMAAVAMVSLMIAPVAYAQGVNPIHFWMTCLVALELGYLSPPVALSHIFTRQVVGEEEAILASQEGDTFYYRNEKFLLPLLVMGTTLLIVAFVPFLFIYN